PRSRAGGPGGGADAARPRAARGDPPPALPDRRRPRRGAGPRGTLPGAGGRGRGGGGARGTGRPPRPRGAPRAVPPARRGGRGAAEALAAVARWVDELDPPKRGAGLDDAATDAAPPPLDRPLWQLPLADEDPPARQGYPGGHQVPALPTLPVVHDDRLYLNETTRLSAIDRFSGRRLWTFEAVGSSVVASPMMARMGRSLD